ncbi:MAG: hypothetical protein BWZ10_02933 [candidate division BRC1 bacterium ADurb.BinA364]|nr:MAG: hypothetical protein BWZ10_02933 [candidate division BRC1 bacterium ADurb.BinA364]
MTPFRRAPREERAARSIEDAKTRADERGFPAKFAILYLALGAWAVWRLIQMLWI